MPAPHRARALSNRHMVAAGNYHAAFVGMNILEAGGNAVDAGVAYNLRANRTTRGPMNHDTHELFKSLSSRISTLRGHL